MLIWICRHYSVINDIGKNHNLKNSILLIKLFFILKLSLSWCGQNKIRARKAGDGVQVPWAWRYSYSSFLDQITTTLRASQHLFACFVTSYCSLICASSGIGVAISGRKRCSVNRLMIYRYEHPRYKGVRTFLF